MIGMNDILRMSPQKFRQAVAKAGGDVDAARSAIAAAIADGVRCIAAFALELAGPVLLAPAREVAIQKGTRVLISLWDSLMFGRVPGTRPNISESHSEISTRVPFCIQSRH